MTWASFLRLGVTPSHSPRFRVEIRAQFPSKIEFLVNPPALAHIVQALFFFFFFTFSSSIIHCSNIAHFL